MSYLIKQLKKLNSEKRWLYTTIEMVKMAPAGAKMWLKDLGKNDFEHAQAIEDYISKILFESKVKLTPDEAYLLLHSIYLHDIGYRADAENHYQKSYDMIIQNPEKYFIHDQYVAEAIAQICLAHGIDDLKSIPTTFPIDFLSKTTQIDLRYLGALLRLGDEMDQGYLRVFNRKGQQESPRVNVYHIEIGPQIIKLKTKPSSQLEWEALKSISDGIQSRLEQMQELLVNRGIKLDHVFLYPTVWIDRSCETSTDMSSQIIKKKVVFLLDGTILGSDILQYFQTEQNSSIEVVPIYYELMEHLPPALYSHCDAIFLFMGESFQEALASNLVAKIEENTKNGGTLVTFPFLSWSISQGINDAIENLIPISFAGEWHENAPHNITKFEKHDITKDIKSFNIMNTYESLQLKSGAECLIRDFYNGPFLSIWPYGRGKVAYLNTSSHLCYERGRGATMLSPWQQSNDLRNIIIRTLKWACGGL